MQKYYCKFVNYKVWVDIPTPIQHVKLWMKSSFESCETRKIYKFLFLNLINVVCLMISVMLVSTFCKTCVLKSYLAKVLTMTHTRVACLTCVFVYNMEWKIEGCWNDNVYAVTTMMMTIYFNHNDRLCDAPCIMMSRPKSS